MKNRMWIHLVMAVLVAGLFLTVSCAKQPVVTDVTINEDQAKKDAEAKAKAEAERIAQQKIDEQMADAEDAMKRVEAAAKNRFENDDIHFEYDSAALSSEGQMILKDKAIWLKDNDSAMVSIEGHCDERGTTDYNLALGDRRATAVKAYLINLGIAGSRLNTISYGEEQPLDAGQNESAYSKNRRAHFALK